MKEYILRKKQYCNKSFASTSAKTRHDIPKRNHNININIATRVRLRLLDGGHLQNETYVFKSAAAEHAVRKKHVLGPCAIRLNRLIRKNTEQRDGSKNQYRFKAREKT